VLKHDEKNTTPSSGFKSAQLNNNFLWKTFLFSSMSIAVRYWYFSELVIY